MKQLNPYDTINVAGAILRLLHDNPIWAWTVDMNRAHNDPVTNPSMLLIYSEIMDRLNLCDSGIAEGSAWTWQSDGCMTMRVCRPALRRWILSSVQSG
jgi:hypothetical protein